MEIFKTSESKIRFHIFFLYFLWTGIIAIFMGANHTDYQKDVWDIVVTEAKITHRDDIILRHWVAKQGGVYVPISDTTPPNPYLANIPERDIVTPSGKRLTLMNPAYVIRQVHEFLQEESEIQRRITSLQPIRPENIADPWEQQALKSFDQGGQEYYSFVDWKGGPFFRYMRPLLTESSCLKCHQQSGLKVGDIQGGISVSIPIQSKFDLIRRHDWMLLRNYGLVWIVGMLGIGFGNSIITKNIRVQIKIEEELRQFRAALDCSFDNVFLIDRKTMRFIDVNASACSTLGYTREELLSLGPLDISSDFTADALTARYDEILYSPTQAGRMEILHRRKNGSVFPVEVSLTGWATLEKTILAAVARDITRFKQAETILKESERFLQSTLDALQEHIAILDEQGTIIAVNAAWKRFAKENQWQNSDYGIGWNYLQICNAAVAAGEIGARDIHDGIREVMAARQNEFSVEYPCHSPQIQRWFNLLVTRFVHNGDVRIVVCHTNITQAKQAEYKILQEAVISHTLSELSAKILQTESYEEISQFVLEHAKQITDSPQGFVGYIDPHSECLISSTLTPERDGSCRPSEPTELFQKCKGLWGWVLNHKFPLLTNNPSSDLRSIGVSNEAIPIQRFIAVPAVIGDVLVGIITVANAEREYRPEDLRSLKRFANLLALALQHTRTEEALEKSERLYREAIEVAGAVPYYQNYQTESYDFVGEGIENLIGCSPEEFTEEIWESTIQEILLRGALKDYSFEAAVAAARRDGIIWQADYRIINCRGEERWIANSAVQVRNERGEVTSSLGILQDITERKQTEKSLQDSRYNFEILFEYSPIAKWELDGAELRNYFQQLRSHGVTDLPAYFNSRPEEIRNCIHKIKVVAVNQATVQLFEAKNKEELITRFYELFPEECIEAMRNCFADSFAGKMDIVFETVLQTLGSHKIHVVIRIAVPPGYEGTLNKIFVTSADITARIRAEEEVKNVRNQLELILNSVGKGIVGLDKEGRVSFINPAAAQMLGYDMEDIQGKDLHLLCHHTLLDGSPYPVEDCPMARSLIDGSVHEGTDEWLWKKDGTVIPIEYISTPIIKNQQILGLVLSFQDITARMKAEKDLIESESNFRNVITWYPDGILIVDREGKLLYMNPVAEELGLQEIPAVHEPHAELEIMNGDSLRFVEMNVVESLWEGKEIYLISLEDITQRKRVEESLRKLSRAVEQSPAVVVITDLLGNIEYVNPKFTTLTGYTYEEVLGKNPRILKSGTHPSEFYTDLWNTIAAGKEWRGEFCNKKKNGELYWEYASISPIRNPDGVITHFVAVKENITERKQAEEWLKQAKEAAEAATRAKSEFLANMSHEIRTPMNGIIGMTELLLQTEMSKQQRDYSHTILRSSEALLTIINDILDYSKIEAGKLILETIPFDLDILVGEVGHLLGISAYRKNLEFILKYESTAPSRFLGDPGRIRQILTNLVGNAIKFTERGHILLEVKCLEQTNGQARMAIKIEDTGIGIAPEKVSHIFDKFTQADSSTTRKYGGTGLGLAISKHLVEMMGGQIQVHSELGKGAVFEFTMNLPQDTSGPKKRSLQTGLEGSRILIVDDYEINRYVLSEYLSSWGIRSTSVASGKAALEALRTAHGEGDPYWLAIVDHQMPDMDGEMLGQAVKADAVLQNTVLFVLTSLNNDEDARRMRQIGFAAYMAKPINRSRLLETLISLYGTQSGTRLSTGPALSMDSTGKSSPPLPTSTPILFTERRILLVEDNPANQLVAKGFLERFGCRVEVVENGLEAIKKLEASAFDLVFMDIQMPIMDGFEATREIRRREGEIHSTRIVAMTANAMKGDREKCMEAGMDDYIAKPLRSNEILQILQKYCPPESPRMGENAGSSQEGVMENSQKKSSTPSDVSLEIFNITEAFQTAGENRQRLIKLLNLVLGDVPKQMEQLKAALKTGDAIAAERHAHTVKGEAANIGAEQLRRYAYQMETAAREGNLIAMETMFSGLEEQFRLVKHAVEASIPEITANNS